MGYAEELVRLLRPLGVYSFREGSFSLGELQALGGALDAAQAKLSRMQRESIPATAEDEGLDRMEALFRYCAGLKDTQARRAAIAAFLQFGGDSFTLQALNRCLQTCGVFCRVAETGKPEHVRVWFPRQMGIPDGFAQMRVIIEDILPCQLDIFYDFRYCTWQETEKYGLRWADLGSMTWMQWMLYHEGAFEEEA